MQLGFALPNIRLPCSVAAIPEPEASDSDVLSGMLAWETTAPPHSHRRRRDVPTLRKDSRADVRPQATWVRAVQCNAAHHTKRQLSTSLHANQDASVSAVESSQRSQLYRIATASFNCSHSSHASQSGNHCPDEGAYRCSTIDGPRCSNY